MLQQSTDVVHCQRAKAGVAVSREQRLAALPKTLVRVHTAAVVRE